MDNLHDMCIPYKNFNLLTNVRIYFFHLINPKYVCNMCNVHVCIHVYFAIGACVNLAS